MKYFRIITVNMLYLIRIFLSSTYIKFGIDADRKFFGGTIEKNAGPYRRNLINYKIFGNSNFLPAKMIVQSNWPSLPNKIIIKSKILKRNYFYIQNGWYYPAWYEGSLASIKRKNEIFHLLASDSRAAIYQSQFCLKTHQHLGERGYINNFVNIPQNKTHVILNPCPDLDRLNENTINKNIYTVMSLSTTPHTYEHQIIPALFAIHLLNDKTEHNFILSILGYIDSIKKDHVIKKVINDLNLENSVRIYPRIGKNELMQIYDKQHIAYHLRYKDSSPNSVLERIALGIPHIFSNSGGTPELVGQGGIPIDVKDSWEHQVPVDYKDLVKGTLEVINNYLSFRELTLEQRNKLSLKNYKKNYNRVFNEF